MYGGGPHSDVMYHVATGTEALANVGGDATFVSV